MKNIILIGLLLSVSTISFSQKKFTSRKGAKFFPSHLEIAITSTDSTVRYELFNHWYAKSYAELRQITISKDSLDVLFGSSNDSLQIELSDNYVRLIDKRYKLNRKIKQTQLCASLDMIRKISSAYSVSMYDENIKHYELYDDEDLDLSEENFREIILMNLKKTQNSRLIKSNSVE